MLVLTRKLEESVVIGNDIVIKILGTKGSQVQLGISAPREIPVYRQEIYDEVVKQNQMAARNSQGIEQKLSSLLGK